MILGAFIAWINWPSWRPLADPKDIKPHSSWSIIKAVRKTGCMTSHEPEQPKWPQLPTHTPRTALFHPALWQNASLASCLWEGFGGRNGWMEGHRGFWADNSSNSSWDCSMQVQMQVTHRTSPCFQATKETGRDLSGQHFGLWRQHDQMTPSRT